jgi:hypothetical protein
MESEYQARVRATIISIRDLLAKFEFYGQADILDRILLVPVDDDRQLAEYLTTSAIWGSSGSVSDVQFVGNVKGGLDFLLAAQRELEADLVALADAISEAGVIHVASTRVADLLRPEVQ